MDKFFGVEKLVPGPHMSNEKHPGCLGCIGDYTTQYMGIFISQYKDPYKPTSIMESRRVFFVAHMIHVWYIHFHLPYKSTKCREIYHFVPWIRHWGDYGGRNFGDLLSAQKWMQNFRKSDMFQRLHTSIFREKTQA